MSRVQQSAVRETHSVLGPTPRWGSHVREAPVQASLPLLWGRGFRQKLSVPGPHLTLSSGMSLRPQVMTTTGRGSWRRGQARLPHRLVPATSRLCAYPDFPALSPSRPTHPRVSAFCSLSLPRVLQSQRPV